MKKQITKSLKTIILTIAILTGAGYVLAWAGPTATNPGNNIPAPLNVGNSSIQPLQVTSGSLGVTADLYANTGYYNILRVGGLPDGSLGNIQIIDSSHGAGKVLVSDADGVGHWVDPSALSVVVGSDGNPVVGNSDTSYLNGVLSSLGSFGSVNNSTVITGEIVVLPNGKCQWSSKQYNNGKTCVIQQQHQGSGFSDYSGSQQYWDYYICSNGFWVFDTGSSKKTAGKTQPDGTVICR